MYDIIICTYNGSTRISDVIDKIINLEKGEELIKNVIIVDNNSLDNTKEIIYSKSKSFSKIKYCFELKQGLSNARRKGLEESVSDWIIYLDDDNFVRKEWLNKLDLYIKKNSDKAGIVNGAVIPKILFDINEIEYKRLNIAYKALACTHISENSIDKNSKIHPFKTAIGAGMAVKRDLLIDLKNEGWLKSEGRKGEILISGEDTEISRYIQNKGYELGFVPEAIIEHLIDKKRIEEDYLVRLYNSFYEFESFQTKYQFLYTFRLKIKKIILTMLKPLYRKDSVKNFCARISYLKGVFIYNE